MIEMFEYPYTGIFKTASEIRCEGYPTAFFYTFKSENATPYYISLFYQCRSE